MWYLFGWPTLLTHIQDSSTWHEYKYNNRGTQWGSGGAEWGSKADEEKWWPETMGGAEVWGNEHWEVCGEYSGGYCAVCIAPWLVKKAQLQTRDGVGHGGEEGGISWLKMITYRAGLEDNRIAVVCSARSTGKKVEGTTSRWVLSHDLFQWLMRFRLLEIFGVLAAANAYKDQESVHYESLVAEYERLVKVIREDHTNAAREEANDNPRRE
jgi:hypothetical protein